VIRKDSIPTLIFFVVIFFWPFLWFEEDFILGADEYSHQYSTSYLKKFASQTWNGFINAGYHTLDIQNWFPHILVNSLLEIVFDNWLVERIYFSILIFATAFILYSLLHNKYKISKWATFPAIVFYFINLYTITNLQAYNVRLIFLCLPLLLLVMEQYKVNRNPLKTALLLALAFLPLTQVSVNVPALSVCFILLVLYAVYFLFMREITFSNLGKMVLYFTVAYLWLNIWWMAVLIPNMLSASEAFATTAGGAALRNVALLGLHNIFRGMGYWAFFAGVGADHRYIEISRFFEMPPGVLLSFTAPVLAGLALLKKGREKHIVLFFLCLMLFFMFLAKGTHGPFGYFYDWAWDNIKMFWIYRDPWAKFTPVVILSQCILIAFTLDWILEKITPRFQKIARNSTLVVTVGILLIFNSNIFASDYYGTMRSLHVKVPDYWKEFENFDKTNDLEYRQLFLPKSPNGSHFWEEGYSSAFPVGALFADKDLLVFPTFSDRGQASDYMIKLLYKYLVQGLDIEELGPGFKLTPEYQLARSSMKHLSEENKQMALKLLGLFNVKQITVQNDYNWISGMPDTYSPSKTKYLLKWFGSFKHQESFGLFTPELLEKINFGRNLLAPQIRRIKRELAGKSGVDVYHLDNKYFIPKIYIADKRFISFSDVRGLIELFKAFQTQWTPRSVSFFLKGMSDEMKKRFDELNKAPKNESQKKAVVEFRKLDPTRYVIKIHHTKENLDLVFNESFHKNWKLYPENIKAHRKPKTPSPLEYKNDQQGQASQKEITSFLEKGWISEVANPENLRFISKNFHNVIQNDNIQDRPIYQNWLKQSPLDDRHFIGNGYANTWSINTSELCASSPKSCTQNSDGTFNLELTMEFWQQRVFLPGVAFSTLGGVLMVSYILASTRFNRRKKNPAPIQEV